MDKVLYLIISLYLVTIIKKANVETSKIKNAFCFEYQLKWVKNMDKVYYLISWFDLVTVLKKTNVETLKRKKVFYFEYHI